MATARDFVTGAMRDRRVIGVNGTPTASEMTYGLARFNAMLSAWAIDGIDFGHVTLAAEDTVDVPANHEQTVRLSLAERLTAFGGGVDPVDAIAAELGRQALRAQYFRIAEIGCEDILSLRQSGTL